MVFAFLNMAKELGDRIFALYLSKQQVKRNKRIEKLGKIMWGHLRFIVWANVRAKMLNTNTVIVFIYWCAYFDLPLYKKRKKIKTLSKNNDQTQLFRRRKKNQFWYAPLQLDFKFGFDFDFPLVKITDSQYQTSTLFFFLSVPKH